MTKQITWRKYSKLLSSLQNYDLKLLGKDAEYSSIFPRLKRSMRKIATKDFVLDIPTLRRIEIGDYIKITDESQKQVELDMVGDLISYMTGDMITKFADMYPEYYNLIQDSYFNIITLITKKYGTDYLYP